MLVGNDAISLPRTGNIVTCSKGGMSPGSQTYALQRGRQLKGEQQLLTGEGDEESALSITKARRSLLQGRVQSPLKSQWIEYGRRESLMNAQLEKTGALLPHRQRIGVQCRCLEDQ